MATLYTSEDPGDWPKVHDPALDSAVTSRRLASRRHNSDKGDPQSETPASHSWDELATWVRVRGALHTFDPAVSPRIKIGRFEAQVEIGRGGFGIVFKVFDPKLKRWVALKLCLTRSQAAIDDLMHEAQVLAALDHPNILPVLEVGEYEGAAFFTMPYVDGENVREFVKWERLPWWKILDLFIDVASGLEAAHGAQPPIVHGDVKPSNILVNRKGFARIADFGLARTLSEESEQEGLRHRAGTLFYMAPEQLRGERGDARSDQFAFCVALYEMLDGQLPFIGTTYAELLEDILQTEVQFEDPSIPNTVLAVLRIGLSVDPCDRFPDMRTLRAELVRLRRSAPDESELEQPQRPDDAEPEDEPPPSHETTPDKPPTDAPPLLGEGGPDQLALMPVGGGPEPSKAKRGTFGASLVLVGAVGLTIGWAGRGRVGSEDARVSEPTPAPESPCAMVASDPKVNSKSALIPTCSRIRAGELSDAAWLWDGEFYDRRRAAAPTPAELTQLRAETLIVARTFVDQAERMSRWAWVAQSIQGAAAMLSWPVPDDPIAAAAYAAENWLLVVENEFQEEGLDLGDPDLQDVPARVERLRKSASQNED